MAVKASRLMVALRSMIGVFPLCLIESASLSPCQTPIRQPACRLKLRQRPQLRRWWHSLQPTFPQTFQTTQQEKNNLLREAVPDTVADEMATGEDAALEEETEEVVAVEEEQEPPVPPSPITRDMYVGLVQ